MRLIRKSAKLLGFPFKNVGKTFILRSTFCVLICTGLFQVAYGKEVSKISSASLTQLTLKTNLSVFSDKRLSPRQLHSLGAVAPSKAHHRLMIPIQELFEGSSLLGLKVRLPFKLTPGHNYFTRKEILQTLKETGIAMNAKTIAGAGITLVLKEPTASHLIRRSTTSTKAAFTPTPNQNIEYFFYFSPRTAKNLTEALIQQAPVPMQIRRFSNGIALTFTGTFLELERSTLTFQTPFSEEPLRTYAEVGKNIFLQKK